MDGSLKRALTDWWLNEIETSVDNYLLSHSYVIDAVPADYTNRPPRDMGLVNQNVKILRDIMDPANEEKYKVKEFVKGLKDTIYVRIDAFTSEVESVLKEEFPFLREGMSGKTIHKMKGSATPLKGSKKTYLPHMDRSSHEWIVEISQEREHTCESDI